MKRLCVECERKRERCIAVVRQSGGVDYVCPQCYEALGYTQHLRKVQDHATQ